VIRRFPAGTRAAARLGSKPDHNPVCAQSQENYTRPSW
jgi:hypothetical protein